MSLNVHFIKLNANRVAEKKFCSISKASNEKQERILALGNFDGLHLGHQKLFNTVKDFANRGGERPASASILSFYPHPRYILSSDYDTKLRFKKLISPLRTRILKLNEFGLDELFIVQFTKSLATLKPTEFIEKIILPLNPRVIVVGEDWCFGRDREGNIGTLIELGKTFDFKVEVVPLKKKSSSENKIGSSQLKNLIEEGKVSEIHNLLGTTFKIYGKVIRGDGRGRTIGVPTANIHSVRQIYPANGVYATHISIEGKIYKSISNVGTRPTFNSSAIRINLETHIFDFDQDIYGKYVEVSFDQRIRGEKKFSNVEELLNQIRTDIAQVAELRSNGN